MCVKVMGGCLVDLIDRYAAGVVLIVALGVNQLGCNGILASASRA